MEIWKKRSNIVKKNMENDLNISDCREYLAMNLIHLENLVVEMNHLTSKIENDDLKSVCEELKRRLKIVRKNSVQALNASLGYTYTVPHYRYDSN